MTFLSRTAQTRNECHGPPASTAHYNDPKYDNQTQQSIDCHHAYDPNLSSAARYSPPNYNTISTIDLDTQLHEIVQSSVANSVGEEYQVDANAITYSNVIFVPSNHPEPENNSLLDPNQAAYILSSDPRLFGSYIRGGDEDETMVDRTAEQSSIPLEYHGYHIQSETGEYIETITGCEQQEVIDTETGDTQIIIQGTNGQFYRQIHNVYVDDGHKVTDTGMSAVELVMNDEQANNYEQTIFHTAYEELRQLDLKSDGGQQHSLDTMSLMPSVADAELLMNSASYGGYKAEYAGLDSDGLLAAHHLIDLGGEFSGQSATGSAVRTQLAEELAYLERQHERNLLESTMSPLCEFFLSRPFLR